MSAGASVRALMSGVIDYAGLFPPAGLAMDVAVQNYASYRTGRHAWMLGRFIVPVGRLAEFESAQAFVGKAAGTEPWRLSVIARPADADALAAFNARHAGRLVIDTVETPPVTPEDVDALAPLAARFGVFAEVPLTSDLIPLLVQLRGVGARAKVRTGGVLAEAIPAPGAVAAFIVACRTAGTAFKATAGLHHLGRASYALTYAPGSACATMHGFLNVLGATLLAHGGGSVGDVEAALASPGAAGISFTDGAMRIGTHVVSAEMIREARVGSFVSFGSCSFDEPVADLVARRLA